MAKSYSNYSNQYNYLSNAYNKKYSKQYDKYTSNLDYSSDFNLKSNKNITEMIIKDMEYNAYKDHLPIDDKRSVLNRAFDVLNIGQYASAGFATGMVDDNITPFEGMVQGIRASNPFGKGHEKWEYSYSGVLEKSGWKPESTSGKIAKGTVGFVADIFLDPMTYVSGGVSGLVKGTGKHSAKVAVGGVEVLDKLGDSAKFIDGVGDTVKGIGMSQEVAESIVKNSKLFKSGIDNLDAVSEGTKLMERYNKLLGVNTKSAEITLSLANAPFGKKIFGDKADKVITLFDSDVVKALGDKTVAPLYGELRNKIFGGKIGELFSTNHSLYKLSKTNPEGVYNAIKHLEYSRGLGMDKNALEKSIRASGNALSSLTPAENAEVLKAMEDKTVWHKVKQTVNFFDTKEAIAYKQKIEAAKLATEKSIDDILKQSDYYDELSNLTEVELGSNKKAIEYMRSELASELINVNDKYAVEVGKAEELLASIKNSTDKYIRTSNIDPSTFKTKFETNFNKPEFVDELSEYLFGKKGFISNKTYDNNLKEVAEMLSSGRSVEEVINFVFDNKDSFTGKSSEMYSFIARELDYSDWKTHYTDPIEKLMKKELKYNESVRELNRLKSVTGGEDAVSKFKLADKLNPEETRELIRLQQTNLKRELLKNEFKDCNTLQDVQNKITQFKDSIYAREVDEIMESIRNGGYKLGQTADEVMRNEFTIQDMLDKYNGGVRKQYHEGTKIAENFKLNDINREELINYFVDKKGVGYVPTKKEHEVYQLIANEAERILEKGYITDKFSFTPNKEFNDLSQKQKQLLFNLATESYNNTGKELSKLTELERLDLSVKAVKEDQLKKHIEVIKNRVKRNTRIEVLHEGSKVEALVNNVITKDGIKEFVIDVNGVEKTIKPHQIRNVFGQAKPRNLDDVRNSSQLFDEFISKQDEVAKLLASSEESINLLKLNKDTDIKRITSKFNDMISNIEVKSIEIEDELFRYREMAKGKDKVEVLTKLAEQSKEYSNILNNSDAFETYMRMSTNLGDSGVDEIIKKYNPHIGEYILDENLNISDKSRDIVTWLRQEMIDMGVDEVGIGKLKQEQFENLMYEYLPHILTPEGEKLLSKDTISKYIPGFGDDFGMGREFNPFSKSRTIKVLPDGNGNFIYNPNITQINEYFNDKLGHLTKGKNVFSESISDIYLARALKHNDLMYDQKYMDNMLEVFGKDYVDKVEEGYTVVMNYGKLREYTSKITRLNTSLDISDNISEHLSESGILRTIDEQAHNMILNNPSYAEVPLKKIKNDLIKEYIDNYMKETLTEGVRHEMYSNQLEAFLKNSNTTGMLDDVALPMSTLNDDQISSFGEFTSNLKLRYENHIRDRASSLLGGGKNNLFKDITIEDIGIKLNDTLEIADELDADRINRILKRIDEYSEIVPPQIKQVENSIVQKANQARQLQIIKDNNGMLEMYDKFTHFMKLNQTAILPGFHSRNKISNMFNNYLAIGQDAVDIDFQKQAYKAMRGDKIDDVLVTVSGKNFDWSDLNQAAIDFGAIDSGVFARDVGAGASSKGLLNKVLSPKLDPTNTKDFIGYTWGTKIGNTVENHDRFIHFVSQVKNGMSFENAAKSVNDYLFDYSDLTMFEMNTMKRIFPYYTWLRKNSALQLNELMDSPEKYRMIGKVMGGIEGMVNEDERINKAFVNEFAQDWIQLPFSVTNPQGRTEPVLLNPNLPFMDIDRIPDPSDPLGTVKDLFTQMNPLIKVPIEQAMNKNVYFDSPIVDKGDSQIGKRIKHVGGQFGIVPVIEGAVQKQGLDFGLHLLNNTSGIKMISYDYEKYKAMKIQQLVKKREESKVDPGVMSSIKRRLGGM